MLPFLQLILRNRYLHFSGRLGGVLSALRRWLRLNFNTLVFFVSCYIVVSRIGPFVSRAGDIAIETFEVEKLIVREFDREGLELFRIAFSKFRVVTRAPYPVLLFGRCVCVCVCIYICVCVCVCVCVGPETTISLSHSERSKTVVHRQWATS